eukprot:scaffold202532_cov13-Tisochrysis_lutea.AAC.1
MDSAPAPVDCIPAPWCRKGDSTKFVNFWVGQGRSKAFKLFERQKEILHHCEHACKGSQAWRLRMHCSSCHNNHPNQIVVKHVSMWQTGTIKKHRT